MVLLILLLDAVTVIRHVLYGDPADQAGGTELIDTAVHRYENDSIEFEWICQGLILFLFTMGLRYNRIILPVRCWQSVIEAEADVDGVRRNVYTGNKRKRLRSRRGRAKEDLKEEGI